MTRPTIIVPVTESELPSGLTVFSVFQPFSQEEQPTFKHQWNPKRLELLENGLTEISGEYPEANSATQLLKTTILDNGMNSQSLQLAVCRATGLTSQELMMISRMEKYVGPLNINSLIKIIPEIRKGDSIDIAKVAEQVLLDSSSVGLDLTFKMVQAQELFSERLVALKKLYFGKSSGCTIPYLTRTSQDLYQGFLDEVKSAVNSKITSAYK